MIDALGRFRFGGSRSNPGRVTLVSPARSPLAGEGVRASQERAKYRPPPGLGVAEPSNPSNILAIEDVPRIDHHRRGREIETQPIGPLSARKASWLRACRTCAPMPAHGGGGSYWSQSPPARLGPAFRFPTLLQPLVVFSLLSCVVFIGHDSLPRAVVWVTFLSNRRHYGQISMTAVTASRAATAYAAGTSRNTEC